MDLRAMLNTDGGGAGHRSGVARPHPPPLTPSIPPPGPGSGPSAASGPGTPATPVQTAPPPLPPHSFRDYPHSAHTSPVSQPREYSSGHANHNNPPSAVLGQVPYASPTSYHPPPGQYSGRPSVPPLQPLAPHDSRSPSSASLSGPSPYRQTPTSSTSAGSAGYPFPLTQQPPASPGHHHQYGPSNYSRDAYSSQPGASSHGLAYSQGQQQQPQPPPQQQQLLLQQQSIPQTPPVGTPGGSQQYLQQRSLSIHSTTTPTSAHSKHSSYPPSFVQGSPIATHHPPAHLEQHHQHQSPQPAPLGLPMSASHRSPTTSYQQPPSPYQQRMPSGAIPYQPIMKASPPPPPPASIPRMPSSGHSAYDAASEAQRRSHSQQSRSERERSMSVSPKTRVPSLPSSTGQSSSVEQDPSFHPQPQRLQPLPPGSMTSMDSQRDVTPAKRKIDDRDLRPDEVENHRQPPPPPKMNGHHAALPQSSSTSPTMTPIRRIIHRSVPIWGQCGRKQKLTASRNFCIKQDKAGLPSSAASANGTQPEPGPAIKTESISRHPSPEDTRSTMPAKEESLKVAVKDPLTFGGQPFPWEPTIESSKPIDVISRSVADFFVFHVLQGPNPAELRARGAQVEIEAKLGTIIDKSTNDRIELRIQAGECVIGEGSRIAFRSSMTTNQHQVLNEYLNGQVKTSLSPRNFTATPRVPIKYVHRRQKDRFFELPAHLRQRLPAPIVNLLPPNAPLKARITYDQMTGNVVAKIVKARVADFHIHMAHMPLDCRISINIEWDWDGPPQEIEQNQVSNKDRQSDRNKDRLSYTHGFYQIDLTQVTQENQGPKGQPGLTTQEHELEIELDSRILYDQGQLLMKGEPNRYADLVDGLVDNVAIRRENPPVVELFQSFS